MNMFIIIVFMVLFTNTMTNRRNISRDRSEFWSIKWELKVYLCGF